MHIWQTLKKPILALAPMEDVTDTVFRRIVASCATPDIYFTEFTNVDGLVSQGREAIIHRLKFTNEERPIVAQIWGMKPENYKTIASQLVEMGFDGIDINMGCPERSVVSHGACSALVNNQTLAKEIIVATKEGVAGKLPVSVKTRIGYKNISNDWIPFLLEQQLDALTIHGRTAAEMSVPPVHWDEIEKAVKLRNDLSIDTVILANGDVKNAKEALEKVKQYGVDGIMMGRAVFDDLWAFEKNEKITHSVKEHLEIMKRHVELFEKTWGQRFPESKSPDSDSGNQYIKSYQILRKFFKIYVRGFEGAGQWREKVMMTKTPQEVYPIIDELLSLDR